MAEWATYTITILSLAAAILAWLAKLRWSKEFEKAKNAEIEVLKQRVAAAEALSPPMLKAHFDAMRNILEERIRMLESQADTADSEPTEREVEILHKVIDYMETQWGPSALRQLKFSMEENGDTKRTHPSS